MKTSHIPWILTILLSLLFWFQTCKHNQIVDRKDDQITSLELEKQTLESLTNIQGNTIHIQDAMIVNYTESLNSLTDTIFKLRKQDQKNRETIAYFKERTVTKLDTILIPYKDTAGEAAKMDSVRNGCIKVWEYLKDSFIFVPKRVEKQTPHYLFTGTVKKDGFEITNLTIQDTLQLRFVEHKKFLRPPKIEVQFFHSNPLITTTQANSVFYKPPKKKRVLEKALLIGAGIFLGTKL